MARLRKLNEWEQEAIKECALSQFANDVHSDPQYAVDTVQFLAECPYRQPMEWWAEMISTDPDMVPELLGFNPFIEE